MIIKPVKLCRSVEMTSTIDIIYVRLLDEGTDVWRPVKAMKVREGIYRIVGSDGRLYTDEHWEFLPDCLVECELTALMNGVHLVAKRLARA